MGRVRKKGSKSFIITLLISDPLYGSSPTAALSQINKVENVAYLFTEVGFLMRQCGEFFATSAVSFKLFRLAKETSRATFSEIETFG